MPIWQKKRWPKSATISGIGFYHVGYDMAVQERYKPTHFKCHDGVVYRGVHNHWESTGQKCLTPEQMKGTNHV